MNQDVINKLRNAGLLSEEPTDLGFVSTGSYALNWVISGMARKGGIPIGRITQFYGEASTAKTVFATHILKDAQDKGYYAVLIDSENSYSSEFAETLGLDPEKLIYAAPDTLEDCFHTIETIVDDIRKVDLDTPIVVAYDSLAVSPCKKELEADNFDSDNMIGALRAKLTGAALRRINTQVLKKKFALVVINQIRSKVGVMYGNPETLASGGNSLEFYLGVSMKTISNKTKDIIKDDNGVPIGIQGRLANKKNKCSHPFRSCEFKLLYDKGLDPYFGIIPVLVSEGILDNSSKGWFSLIGEEKKYRASDIETALREGTHREELKPVFDFFEQE